MPPKKGKKEEAPKRVVLGRPGNNVKMGIVGLPNVGKSSTFNLLSRQSVPAENFPFCTVDPNLARVGVPDERFDFLCGMYTPPSRVSAFLSVTDIAGLIRGASEGAGLGNAFLSHIRAVDAIFHVSRAFEDEEVVHVDGDVDPIRDLETIHDELRLKDMEIVRSVVDPLKRLVDRGAAPNEKRQEYETLQKVVSTLEEGKDVRSVHWTANEIEVLNQHQFLTAKPMVYLINLSERDFLRKRNRWLARIAEWINARGNGDQVIPYSCEFEQKILDLGEEEAAKYLEETGGKSMIPRIIWAGYKTLQLIHYFTVGHDEVKCWTIREGTLAPQAAGVIHTDFERGFICAEVMKFDDLKEIGNETEVKAAGKCRQMGRSYEVLDGDIIHFRFNVSNSGKK